MSKDTTFIGQPIFLQVVKLLHRADIRSIERNSATNHYTKKFDGYNHLVTLLFSHLANCDSIREVVVGMLSLANKLTHLGLITNNFELSPNEIVEIYRRRWQIETLFKQMKQNFQLKCFLGDNVNAIECQVWVVMIANLLLSIIKSGVKRVCSYTGVVSLIRLQLMSYISLYDMLEKPEKSWLDLLKRQKQEFTGILFDR